MGDDLPDIPVVKLGDAVVVTGGWAGLITRADHDGDDDKDIPSDFVVSDA